jgi:hypothetical protein
VTPTLATWSLGNQFFAGHAFDLTAATAQSFSLPVTVTLRYSDADLRVIADESALTLPWWTGSRWVDAGTTCPSAPVHNRDVVNNILEVAVCRKAATRCSGRRINPIFLCAGRPCLLPTIRAMLMIICQCCIQLCPIAKHIDCHAVPRLAWPAGCASPKEIYEQDRAPYVGRAVKRQLVLCDSSARAVSAAVFRNCQAGRAHV